MSTETDAINWHTVEIKFDFDMIGWHFANVIAKRKRESRLSYRLRKWFLSLRWVNNLLWYRVNTKLDLRGVYKRWYHKTTGGYNAIKKRHNVKIEYMEVERTLPDDTMVHSGRIYFPAPSTFHLPDYPSIRELSNERPKQ